MDLNFNNIATIISIVLAVISIAIAVWQGKEKAKIEKMVKTQFSYMSGDILSIRDNTQWSSDRIQQAMNLVNEKGELDLKKINENLLFAGRDVTSAQRMLTLHLSHMKSLQESLYDELIIKQQETWSEGHKNLSFQEKTSSNSNK